MDMDNIGSEDVISKHRIPSGVMQHFSTGLKKHRSSQLSKAHNK